MPRVLNYKRDGLPEVPSTPAARCVNTRTRLARSGIGGSSSPMAFAAAITRRKLSSHTGGSP